MSSIRTHRRILLPSSQPAAGVPSVERPVSDIEVIAGDLEMPILSPGPGSPLLAGIEQRTRFEISQAARAYRRRADIMVALSERVGIPLVALRPPGRTIVVTHLLTTRSKRIATTAVRFFSTADVVLTYSRAQERHLREREGLGADRCRFVYDKVDAAFFSPADAAVPVEPFVLAVGREMRDYETLLNAMRQIDVRTVLVPGSAWSHRSLPAITESERVEVRSGLSYGALRDLYRSASVVVVPILPGIDYAAGVNSLLEAMACGRATVVSDIPGLAGYITDGEDGRVVRAGDPEALAQEIRALLSDPSRATELGRRARHTVEQKMTVQHFAGAVSRIVEELEAA